ncbi:MAG TPA: hypothetical protein VFE62_26825 [Gemmataceae bacterium]|nr:hypothetical protein [Gemmataceae bacterium]
MLRRLFFAVLLAPCLTGCMTYAYPTIIYTPDQPIDNPDGGAHAFRVDIDKTERKPLPSTVQYTLMRIPLDRSGLVPSQLEIAPASGTYNPFGVGQGAEHERNLYTMAVRLYRPGYETKELRAWDKARSPMWTKARDLLAEEKAVDDLLAVPSDQPTGKSWWDLQSEKTQSLQPGSVSHAQHNSLLFASSEYDRLAKSPAAGAASMTTVRQRLQQKALVLRNLAEQQPPR